MAVFIVVVLRNTERELRGRKGEGRERLEGKRVGWVGDTFSIYLSATFASSFPTHVYSFSNH